MQSSAVLRRCGAWRSRAWAAACVIVAATASVAGVDAPEAARREQDIAAARSVFRANLDAIRNGDRDAYLATYLHSESLARTGNSGIQFGYADHEAGTSGTSWPNVFVARNLQFAWLAPGVVYGTYRYRVAFGSIERIGLSERVFVETEAGWRIAVTAAFDTPPGTPPPPLALRGATLVDGTGAPPVVDAVVVVRGGRIECAGSATDCDVPAEVETLDMSGTWITPGLVDAHVHFSQTGWADGRPDAVDVRDTHPYETVQADLRANPERFLRSQLGCGITAVFDVGGYAWTWSLRDSLRSDAPHVAAAGPLLTTLDHWLNLPAERQFIYMADEASTREGVRYLAARGSDAVKVWFVATSSRDFGEMERVVLAAGDETRKLGLPLIVHATELETAKVALRAGAHLLVHSVWDVEIDADFVRLARAAGTIYCPTLIVSGGYTRLMTAILESTVPAIDDPHACVDAQTLERLRGTASLGADKVDPARLERMRQRQAARSVAMKANLKRVLDAGIPIAMGTDAGNPLTLHGPSVFAEMEAMQDAGMTAMQVLEAATRGGASAMQRETDFGTIEAGKIADLLVLDADPTRDIRNMRTVQHVMRRGELRAVREFRRPD